MTTINTSVTGFSHLDDHEQRKYSQLLKGMVLDLKREPANRYDPLAIRVCRDDVMVGYIPKADNREIAAALDGGLPVKCVCQNFPVIDGNRCIAQAQIAVTW